jgi:hypothetical protein
VQSSSTAYRPRDAATGVLHAVVRDHLEEFLHLARAHGDGRGVPAFVERELRGFLTCGVLAHGFARLRCADCGFERFVPFSCKGRGFCPSCGGRRMAERAANLVDRVLPAVPLRQWVLTVPHRLRYLMAWDHRLCRAVLAVYVRVLCGWYRRRGRRRGLADPRTGTVTAIQRFGGGLNLHVHYHTLVLDGVFVRDDAGEAVFRPLPPPTDADVARILGTIARRVRRLLARRGLLPGGADEGEGDVAADLSPSLALMTAGAVQGREALGPAAGRRIAQVGRDPTRPWQPSTGPRQAHQDGFDLHANVRVGPLDRRGREHLVQYVLRPPLAQPRLQRRRDGHVVLALQRPWRDGTRALVFPPLAVLERLAALTPRPRINLLVYHGVLAPNAAWRAAVVPVAAECEASGDDASGAAAADSASRGRHIAWATLLQRVFEVDVLACPRCDGRLELLATLEEPTVVRRILTHVGLPAEPVTPRAPPPAPDAFSEPA